MRFEMESCGTMDRPQPAAQPAAGGFLFSRDRFYSLRTPNRSTTVSKYPEIVTFTCAGFGMAPALVLWAVFNFLDNRGGDR